jgi:hypothetical protein
VTEDDVPKLPRGRGIRLSRVQLVRIAGTSAVLVVLLLMQRPCARAVSSFVTSFDGRGSAGQGSAAHRPGMRGSGVAPSTSVDGPAGAAPPSAGEPAKRLNDYERLQPGMTDDEVKAAIERARVRSAPRPSPAP